MGRRRSQGTTSDIPPPLEADMRKRFLVLASVATMALAGTAMPAFADSGTAATTTTATPVSITCNVTTKTSTGASTTSSYTLNVSQQAATYLTANTPRTVTYLGTTITVNCGK